MRAKPVLPQGAKFFGGWMGHRSHASGLRFCRGGPILEVAGKFGKVGERGEKFGVAVQDFFEKFLRAGIIGEVVPDYSQPAGGFEGIRIEAPRGFEGVARDRKSTRLNSSH